MKNSKAQHEAILLLFSLQGVTLTSIERTPLKNRPGRLRIHSSSGVTDDVPPDWIRDYRRAVHRFHWIKWRDRIHRIMRAKSTERANRVMGLLGWKSPQLAEKKAAE